MIRPFTRDDVPEIVRLHGRAFGMETAMPPAELARHFEEVLLDSPWADPGMPSLVWEEPSGVVGFIGVLPRPMCFRGAPVRAVVTTQMMVDPETAHPLVATRLTRSVFDSGYDLVLTDGASPRVLKLWRALGAEALWLHSLTWRRPLRPAADLVRSLERRRPRLSSVTWLGRPLTSAADVAFGMLPPNRFRRRTSSLMEEPAEPAGLLAARRAIVNGGALGAHYDDASFAWLLARLGERKVHGPLCGAVLRDGDGSFVGWHLCFVQSGGEAAVVDLGARPDRQEEVLAHLFAHAAERGAVAVQGVAEASLLPAVAEMHGYLRAGAPWALAHSTRPELLAALHGGDTSLGRLDGEFWMRFRGG